MKCLRLNVNINLFKLKLFHDEFLGEVSLVHQYASKAINNSTLETSQ
jgi:hypothetical protein